MPLTSSSKCHVLDFLYDEQGDSELTVLNNGVRFHITVEVGQLSNVPETQKDYLNLLDSVRSQDEQEGVLSGGTGTSSTSSAGKDEITSSQADGTRSSQKDLDETSDGVEDAHSVLQNWILQPFGEEFQELAPRGRRPHRQTVHEWYHPPTYFFDLRTLDGGNLGPVELEPSSRRRAQVERLMPEMTLPKYLREARIPFISSEDLMILSTSDYPPPLHPTRVRKSDSEKQTYFLKLVDSSQHSPVKREIKLLLEAEKQGLCEQIHIPKLEAFVSIDQSKTKILGFLLSDIPSPTPLTTLLNSDVDECKRQRWADEVRRTTDLLHQHAIIWGDAKADNFLVDTDDELWIIDFGGSYTEGWVDPDLNETREGDEMGVRKIVDALRDPDEDAEEVEECREKCSEESEDKRHQRQPRPEHESRRNAEQTLKDVGEGNEESTNRRKRKVSEEVRESDSKSFERPKRPKQSQ